MGGGSVQFSRYQLVTSLASKGHRRVADQSIPCCLNGIWSSEPASIQSTWILSGLDFNLGCAFPKKKTSAVFARLLWGPVLQIAHRIGNEGLMIGISHTRACQAFLKHSLWVELLSRSQAEVVKRIWYDFSRYSRNKIIGPSTLQKSNMTMESGPHWYPIVC